MQSDVAKRFVGVWRYVGTQIDSKPRPNRGANPKGFIFYTESGAMAAQIAPDRDNKMAGHEPTPDEAKAALADYISYFGTYTVDARAGTVTHHRQASVQPGPLTDYVRSYEFMGDRLILRAGRHHAGSGVGADKVNNSSLRAHNASLRTKRSNLRPACERCRDCFVALRAPRNDGDFRSTMPRCKWTS